MAAESFWLRAGVTVFICWSVNPFTVICGITGRSCCLFYFILSHRSLLRTAVLFLLPKKSPRLPEDLARKPKNRQQVRRYHQHIEGVADLPYEIQPAHTADHDARQIQQLIGHERS